MSLFAEDVLNYIQDTKPLGAHLAKPAVNELYLGYQRFANANEELPLITDESSGWDFKQAVALLTPEQQVSLYYPYLRAISAQFDAQENPAKQRSDIRMKEFYIKLASVGLFGILAALAGAAIVVAVHSGKAPSSEIFETFLKTATEIAEVIFARGAE